MLYVNTSKIRSMSKNPQMYTDLEEIPSMQPTSLTCLYFPQCNALQHHNQNSVGHLLLKLNFKK